jgi:hypothetical protein
MSRVNFTVWLLPPPAPVIVKVLVPAGAPSRTETPIVDVPEPPVIEVGMKVTTTWLGTPDADKETAESKPLPAVVVIVELPEPPQLRLSELGDALSVKSPPLPPPPELEMVKLTVVVAVMAPLVPVTVIV